MDNASKEYEAFKVLEHWQPAKKILSAEELANAYDKLFPLFLFLYNKTKELYQNLPPRKNGEVAFIHPTNLVLELRKAKINDIMTLSAGLAHDFVEEKVDLYMTENKLEENGEGIKILDQQELVFFKELEEELKEFCNQNGIQVSVAEEIIKIVRLLTRHKRHFYYKSISQIFNCKDDNIKEKAIQIKLADRAHNILCIECFNEEQRIFQAFKNLFILNNTKHYLLEKYGQGVFDCKPYSATERLFNKCSKATYDAFFTICQLSGDKGIRELKSMIQLAFKKFVFEKMGLRGVTDLDSSENHPIRLFQNIIRKYDARLHHEREKFDFMKESEYQYCKRFFSDYNLSPEKLKAIIDYKDAYALKEAVAQILYQHQTIIAKFLCSDLTRKGRID